MGAHPETCRDTPRRHRTSSPLCARSHRALRECLDISRRAGLSTGQSTFSIFLRMPSPGFVTPDGDTGAFVGNRGSEGSASEQAHSRDTNTNVRIQRFFMCQPPDRGDPCHKDQPPGVGAAASPRGYLIWSIPDVLREWIYKRRPPQREHAPPADVHSTPDAWRFGPTTSHANRSDAEVRIARSSRSRTTSFVSAIAISVARWRPGAVPQAPHRVGCRHLDRASGSWLPHSSSPRFMTGGSDECHAVPGHDR